MYAENDQERYAIDDNGMIYDSQRDVYIPEYFTRDTDGLLVELSLNEAVEKLNLEEEKRLNLINSMQSSNNYYTLISPTNSFGWVYQVDANSPYTYYELPEKLTTTLQCPDHPGTIQCEKEFTYSLTKSSSYTAGLSVAAFQVFEANLSFTLENSVSVSDVSKVNVRPGYEVWMEGRAKMNFENGVLIRYSLGIETDRIYTSAKSPVRLSNGILEADIYPVLRKM